MPREPLGVDASPEAGAPPRVVRIGWFGKVPTVGDFVARNVAPELRARLDGWLERSIARSRDAMGEAWLPAFLEAPVWRFVLHATPGTGTGASAGAGAATIGLMIPSVDRVGRYFPFVMLAELDRAPRTRDDLASADETLSLIEPHLLGVLDEAFDLDTFEYETSRIARALRDGAVRPFAIAALDHAVPDMPVTAAATTPDETWWWTEGADHRAAEFLRFDDMPPPDEFAALLRDADPHAPLAELWDAAGRGSPTDNGAVAFTTRVGGHVAHVIAGPSGGGASPAFAEADAAGGTLCATPGRAGEPLAARAARFACRAALMQPAPSPTSLAAVLAERGTALPPLVTVGDAGVTFSHELFAIRCRDGAFGPVRSGGGDVAVPGNTDATVPLALAPGERLLVAERGLAPLAPHCGAHLSRADIAGAAHAIWEEALVGAPGAVRLLVLIDRPACPIEDGS